MKWSSDITGRARASRLLAALPLWGCVQLAAGAQDAGADRAEEEEAGPASSVQVLDVYFPENLARNLQREGGWLAAYVELKTTGAKAETVILESVVSDGKTRAFEAKQTVDVAPGAPRRAWA